MNIIKNWYKGKRIQLNKDEPDTYGDLNVIHEYETKYHWTAKIIRAVGRIRREAIRHKRSLDAKRRMDFPSCFFIADDCF